MKLVPWRKPPAEERSEPFDFPLEEWIAQLQMFGGRVNTTLPGQKQEIPDNDFRSLVTTVFKSDGVVFACMLARMAVFSEARFVFRRLRNGQPAGIFGSSDLAVLEQPWQAGTTGDLLAKALQYADLAGNAYFARRPTGLMPLRPDWVDIVIGSPHDASVGAWDVDSEVLGYIYTPGGRNSGNPQVPFLASDVAHFAPIPDPEAQFRGMSWLTPIIREVMADKAATQHKLAFWENAATMNLAIKLDTDDLEKYKDFVEMFRESHEGASKAYKTLFLAAGADVTPIGANLEQASFKDVTGAGETRIAAAARVPPIIVGLSEGLAAATYSNYGQARRAFADATLRPLWANFCGSIAPIINVPAGCELWFDDTQIAFLREDQKDAAQIMSLNAISISQLVNGGFDADSVTAAVAAGDVTLLKHTGLTSVQLQKPQLPGADTSALPSTTADDEPDEAAKALAQVQAVLALNAG